MAEKKTTVREHTRKVAPRKSPLAKMSVDDLKLSLGHAVAAEMNAQPKSEDATKAAMVADALKTELRMRGESADVIAAASTGVSHRSLGGKSGSSGSTNRGGTVAHATLGGGGSRSKGSGGTAHRSLGGGGIAPTHGSRGLGSSNPTHASKNPSGQKKLKGTGTGSQHKVLGGGSHKPFSATGGSGSHRSLGGGKGSSSGGSGVTHNVLGGGHA